MTKKPRPTPLERIRRKHQRMANLALEIESDLDRAQKQDSLGNGTHRSNRGKEEVLHAKRVARDRDLLRILAMRGAESLEIVSLPEASAMIRVDRGRWVLLAPKLAQLLEALVGNLESDQDGLLKWRSMASLVRAMKMSGRGMTDLQHKKARHAIQERIRRVRHTLQEQEVNPHLLQTDSKRGVRFAVLPAGVVRIERPDLVQDWDVGAETPGNEGSPFA